MKRNPLLAGRFRAFTASCGEPLVVEDRSAPPVEDYRDEPVGPIEISPWVGRVISVR